MGMFDWLLGSEKSYDTINTQGPRTEEGTQFWSDFMKTYGEGGSFDPTKQAEQYAAWQDLLYNTPATQISVPGTGVTTSFMDPSLRQRNSLINSTMQYAYTPFTNATMQLEQLRNGQNQAVQTGGDSGLLSSLAPAVGLWAAGGWKSPFSGSSSGGGNGISNAVPTWGTDSPSWFTGLGGSFM